MHRQRNLPLNLVVNVDISDDVIMDWIADRWVHIPSGRVYSTSYNPPKVPGCDDVTGEPLTKRPDDTPVRRSLIPIMMVVLMFSRVITGNLLSTVGSLLLTDVTVALLLCIKITTCYAPCKPGWRFDHVMAHTGKHSRGIFSCYP